jgi:hypothetical protein
MSEVEGNRSDGNAPPGRNVNSRAGSLPGRMAPVAVLGIAIGVVVVVVAIYFVWALASNRRAGASGMVRSVHLECPKCGKGFDYSFVPGASLTALRLGTGRYMACPLCGRWSVFPLLGAPLASSGSPPPTPPT